MTTATISTTITGVHPYAEAWPLLSDDDLAELAEDIKANGLRDAIVLYQGLILDGRNRQAACERAGVEPHYREFEGDDDEALAFVQSANNARRHQSKGSLAASWALSMLAAGKRSVDSAGKKRWAGAKGKPQNSEGINYEMQSRLGFIADYAPELLTEVRDDAKTLNSAYAEAENARTAERDKLEWQERMEAEEADAKAFVQEQAPDYADRVEGGELSSYAVAKTEWEQDNRKRAAELRWQEEEKRKAEERRRSSLNHTYRTIADALRVIGDYGRYEPEALDKLMADYSPSYLKLGDHADHFKPQNLKRGIAFLNHLLNHQENSNA